MSTPTLARSAALIALLAAMPACSLLRVNGDPVHGEEAPAAGQAAASHADGDSAAASSDADQDAAPAKKADPATPHNPLEKLTVTARFPQFKSEDSFSLDRVGAALQLATPDMVRYIPKADSSVYFEPAPLKSGEHPGFHHTDKACPDQKGFTIQAGQNRVIDERVCAKESSFQHVAAGTPVLVWELVEHKDAGRTYYSAVVVTLDGGRYTVGFDVLDGLLADATAADTELQHTFVGRLEISAIGKYDEAAKSASTEIKAVRDEYDACNLKILDKQEKAIASLPAMSASARSARVAEIGQQHLAQQEAQCDKYLSKLHDVQGAFLEKRNEKRRELAKKASRLRTK